MNPEVYMKFLCCIFTICTLGVPPVRAQAPVADTASVDAGPPPSAALFVGNRARGRPGLDEEVDSLRELISSEMAGEIAVLDPQYIADAFRKGKVDSGAEQNRLVEGVFTGGSALQVAKLLGADYLITVAVNSADSFNFQNHVTYRTTLSVKVLDGATGKSVDGFRVTRQQPVRGVGAEGEALFRILFEDAAADIGRKLAANRKTWPAPAEAEAEKVALTVGTPIDSLLNGLEVGARAPNELLDEMRRVVGGVTVWIDGAVVGSSPGTFEVAPGMHTVRVTRQWMEPWEAVVNVREDMTLNVALELSEAGIRKWKSVEGFKANLALEYARALLTRGITVNFDTTNWERVGGTLGQPVEVLLENAP